jgi:hypothetical protein
LSDKKELQQKFVDGISFGFDCNRVFERRMNEMKATTNRSIESRHAAGILKAVGGDSTQKTKDFQYRLEAYFKARFQFFRTCGRSTGASRSRRIDHKHICGKIGFP